MAGKGRKKGQKTPTKQEDTTQTGRTLPGRTFLLGLVAFVAIFLDFETSSIKSFRPDDVASYDAERVVRDVEELGKMQQYQLEKQWSDYERRTMNDTAPSEANETAALVENTGPEEIVIEEEKPIPNQKNATETDGQQNDIPAQSFNVSVEEITVEAEASTQSNTITVTSLVATSTETSPAVIGDNTENKQEEIVVQISDECYPHNSQRWLTGKRHSNVDTNLTSDFAYQQILMPAPLLPDALWHVSSQTICHVQSQFRNPSGEWNLEDERLLDEWELQLIYMAIHRYHHAPAVLEAQKRISCPPSSTLTIPTMDYQCPDAKFFVVNMNPIGLGAALRLGAAAALLVGMAADRIVVFVNNFKGSQAEFLQTPWPMASCSRHDLQCFYLPTTPCTILEEDIRNAVVLPEIDARDLRRQGLLLKPEYANETVLIYEGKPAFARKFRIQDKIREKLYALSMQLIESIRPAAPPEQILFLETAAARINIDDDAGHENATETQYMNRYSKSSHAALLYLMRPTPHYQTKSDEIVAASLQQPSDHIDLSLTVGLPIRGSDKCTAESICYDFDRYMQLMSRMWQDELQTPTEKKATIILTTEDESIFKARTSYESNESFPFQFVVNQNDVFQGSGLPKKFAEHGNEVMLASIVSLKMQLLPRYTVGNCCSNFHLMLFDLLHSGCGALPGGQTMCLQDDPDPQFRICCGWTKNEECDRIRDAQAAERREQEAIAKGNETVAEKKSSTEISSESIETVSTDKAEMTERSESEIGNKTSSSPEASTESETVPAKSDETESRKSDNVATNKTSTSSKEQVDPKTDKSTEATSKSEASTKSNKPDSSERIVEGKAEQQAKNSSTATNTTKSARY